MKTIHRNTDHFRQEKVPMTEADADRKRYTNRSPYSQVRVRHRLPPCKAVGVRTEAAAALSGGIDHRYHR